MAPHSICALCGIIIAAVTHFHGVDAQKSCNSKEFWNSDLDVCVPCASCKQYPKTPSCNTCKSIDNTPDWEQRYSSGSWFTYASPTGGLYANLLKKLQDLFIKLSIKPEVHSLIL
uniref:Uncharacterized protein n=1 Tax=Knipowitschia caucasica TaxID=637954 RepID=A0AAV2LFH0_KNICA